MCTSGRLVPGLQGSDKMAESTSIEWCDSTFNPWIGCARVSPACDACYAARSAPARTLGLVWGAGQPRRRTADSTWAQPRTWQRQADAFMAQHGHRRRVFSASLADWLDNEVPVEWLADLLQLVRSTPDLDWLLLSKRIGNWRSRMLAVLDLAARGDGLRRWPELAGDVVEWLAGRPLPNVWLGATVVSQQEVDRDVPKLLRVPAVRFLSVEPMLGPIHLDEFHPNRVSAYPKLLDGIDWVICGGESGPTARPTHPDWVRSLRDQCGAANVPFFFKQWGEYLPVGQVRATGAETVVPRTGHAWDDGTTAWKIGTKAAGRRLDGMEHLAWPA